MAIVEKAQSIIEKAKAFAATKHASQRRKYTDEPYTAHLVAVVGILARHGVRDPNVLAAAYLHDTVEDTETTIAEILEAFNAPVASTNARANALNVLKQCPFHVVPPVLAAMKRQPSIWSKGFAEKRPA